MTISTTSFIQAELEARFAGHTEQGQYALECADVEELRNYPAVDSALAATHKTLGAGYVIFEGFLNGSHVVVFQAETVDRDRPGRDGRFISKYTAAGYVSDTLKQVCEHIGDTDVVERAIDSYVYVDGFNWYAANPDALVVDRPTATSAPVSNVTPVLERKRQRAVERAKAAVTTNTFAEDVEDSFCPEWMAGELAEAWSDYETFGDF